ncbi:MAG TPA: hypothetical protein VD788_01625 [Candidatus Polarisedimenticolaceae bacterium]|nr:hypothetical protein [Candidatus Polarisedimenticolaceae bacterium]
MIGTRRLAALCLTLLVVGCAKRRSIEYEMHWSDLVEPDHIVLIFAEFPNHYLDLVSGDLRAYLDTLPDDRVRVELELTTRLGCVERIRLVRIDDWRGAAKEWAGSGWVEREDPSPWDALGCRVPWW